MVWWLFYVVLTPLVDLYPHLSFDPDTTWAGFYGATYMLQSKYPSRQVFLTNHIFWQLSYAMPCQTYSVNINILANWAPSMQTRKLTSDCMNSINLYIVLPCFTMPHLKPLTKRWCEWCYSQTFSELLQFFSGRSLMQQSRPDAHHIEGHQLQWSHIVSKFGICSVNFYQFLSSHDCHD